VFAKSCRDHRPVQTCHRLSNTDEQDPRRARFITVECNQNVPGLTLLVLLVAIFSLLVTLQEFLFADFDFLHQPVTTQIDVFEIDGLGRQKSIRPCIVVGRDVLFLYDHGFGQCSNIKSCNRYLALFTKEIQVAAIFGWSDKCSRADATLHLTDAYALSLLRLEHTCNLRRLIEPAVVEVFLENAALLKLRRPLNNFGHHAIIDSVASLSRMQLKQRVTDQSFQHAALYRGQVFGRQLAVLRQLQQLILIGVLKLKQRDLCIVHPGSPASGQEVVVGNAEKCERHEDDGQNRHRKTTGQSVTYSLQHVGNQLVEWSLQPWTAKA